MTVSDSGNKIQYTGNGVTSTFSTGSIIFYDDTDLIVTETVIATGVDTVYTITTDYTVTGGEGAAGSVTLVAGALPATKRLTIERSIPYTQTDDFVEGEAILANTIETSSDKGVIRDQQLRDGLNDCLRISATSSYSGSLTVAEPVAGELLGWNSTKTGLAGYKLADLSLSIDTAISGAANGDFLIYDGTNWVNKTIAQTVTALGVPTLSGTNSFSGQNSFSGKTVINGVLAIEDDGELTIATGAVTITGANHTIDTEGDAATDDLDTISGGSEGAVLVLRPESAARVVTIKDGAGNIETPDGNDIELDAVEKTVSMHYDGTLAKWVVDSVFAAAASGITLGTPTATTSGTSVDYTSIPTGTKRITIMLNGVSTIGTSDYIVQIGDSGGIETSGYAGATAALVTGSTVTNWTSGAIAVSGVGAGGSYNGKIILDLLNSSTNTWSFGVVVSQQGGLELGAGTKALTAELDRIRLTTVGGTDTFDAGSVNISYE